MRILLLTHWLHPDDVVSARLFSGLALGLKERGWDVEASACNREFRNCKARLPRRESWEGIDVRRVWRPAIPQSSHVGRLFNSAWMMAAWSASLTLRMRNMPDVVLIGSDPQFGVMTSAIIGRTRPSLPIAHWCYDVFPEAIAAHGVMRETSLLYRFVQRVMKSGYRRCDLIADLGSCMRRRLAAYGVPARRTTITPWALTEPETVPAPDPEARQAMFGDARLGLLYTGNFGQAHTAEEFLRLARALRGESIRFCFAVRGTRADELRRQVGPDDSNVTFGAFADEEELPRHLSAGDIHMASLGSDWTGLAVPSKFFGSLATGRPVLFSGPPESSVAGWIRQHGIGWHLNEDTVGSIAGQLRRLAENPAAIRPLQARCREIYTHHFSREQMVDRWDVALRALVPVTARRPRASEYAPSDVEETAPEFEGV